MKTELSLYIHIPFCAVRCAYCDFNTFAGLEKYYEPYAAALQAEIRRAATERGRLRVPTVFIGGGTPSVLPPQLLEQVLATCRSEFDIAPDAEITSEANPGTVDQARFTALREMGVNRLSMGVQSFDDKELAWLGRIHSAGEAEAAFAAARAAGFDNINLDFIFGLPGQDPATWTSTLARAIDLGPEHLSLYSLIIEQGTPLATRVRRHEVPDTDDDLAADLYLAASQSLAAHGYVHYEISNWAKDGHLEKDGGDQALRQPGFACRHNLVYWHDQPYLGFGPGAHSYDGERRWWNVRPVPEYIQRLAKGSSPESGGELIDRRLAMGETMMLGLRLVREGVTEERFRTRFGAGLEETFGAEIATLVQDGLMERTSGGVRLTERGRLLGNQVFARFLPDAS